MNTHYVKPFSFAEFLGLKKVSKHIDGWAFSEPSRDERRSDRKRERQSRRAGYARMAVLSVLVLALAACAGKGMPPNIFNKLVGDGLVIGERVLIVDANQRLAAAYTAGKIDRATYDAAYASEGAAQTALDALGARIRANQPVTQDEFDTAVANVIQPYLTLVDRLAPALPPPVTTRPG